MSPGAVNKRQVKNKFRGKRVKSKAKIAPSSLIYHNLVNPVQREKPICRVISLPRAIEAAVETAPP